MGIQSWTQGQGPLVPFAAGFRNSLLGVGHPPASLKHHLALMGQLNRWLDAEGVGVDKLTPGIAQQFLDDRRAAGQRRVPTLATLAPLFDHMREQGVLPVEAPTEPTLREELLAGYRHHLVHDRGLAATTVRRYANFATRFLAERARRAGAGAGADGLTSAEVNAFMLEAGTRLVVDSAKREAADLRALLRYLYLSGVLSIDLGAAMPPVATWRGGALVPTMSPADVDRLLASYEENHPCKRRDGLMPRACSVSPRTRVPGADRSGGPGAGRHWRDG